MAPWAWCDEESDKIDCHGTGYTLRTTFIERANPGMVEGGLMAALLPMFRGKGERLPLAHVITKLTEWLCEEGGDHRIEGLEAVANWLELQTGEVKDA